MPGRRTRRFQAFCVGLPKTGTTSIGTIFENYRSAKLAGSGQKLVACDFRDGKLSEGEVREFVLRRDAEEWLEMDATSGNWTVLRFLKELHPAARFILTIRDCYSWCDSMLNVLIARELGNDFVGSDEIFRRFFGCDIELFRDTETVLRYGDTILDTLLSFWTQQLRTARECPPSRTLVLRTNEISSNLQAMADFVGVLPETLLPERSHSRRTARKFNVLQKLDYALLESKFAEPAASGLMREYFPTATLMGFLNARDARPSVLSPAASEHVEVAELDRHPLRHLYPIGFWLNQAEAAASCGRRALAESCLAEASKLGLEPDELRRVEAVHVKIGKPQDVSKGVRQFAAPEPVAIADRSGADPAPGPPSTPATGRREITEALAVIRALATRGAERRFGYRLQQHEIRVEGEACRALLVFANGRRRFDLEVGLRDATARHWLASERFAVWYRRATPPTTPSEQQLAQLLLAAIERHVR